ncbi:hypothetical protein CEXT_473841 [Caerostris extrusa]|uniref:Uncharacterized protein n=1 Tax=Caerostris extrusa TaxID=172846 RepID=A0AAV4UMS2_CAEEX|nr:hypothetical protein CEXT_473841 [Caerostris extrusa]
MYSTDWCRNPDLKYRVPKGGAVVTTLTSLVGGLFVMCTRPTGNEDLDTVSMTEYHHHPMKIVLNQAMDTYAYRCCGIALASYSQLPSSSLNID